MKYENCYLSKDLALGSNVIMVSPNMLDYSVVVYQICVLNWCLKTKIIMFQL